MSKKVTNKHQAIIYIEGRKDHFWHKSNIPRYQIMQEFLEHLRGRKRISKIELQLIMTVGIDFEVPIIERHIIYG